MNGNRKKIYEICGIKYLKESRRYDMKINLYNCSKVKNLKELNEKYELWPAAVAKSTVSSTMAVSMPTTLIYCH